MVVSVSVVLRSLEEYEYRVSIFNSDELYIRNIIEQQDIINVDMSQKHPPTTSSPNLHPIKNNYSRFLCLELCLVDRPQWIKNFATCETADGKRHLLVKTEINRVYHFC